MPAVFGDVAVVEHDDLVGLANGGQAVRDGQHRDLAAQGFQRLLHLTLGLGVDVGGGLVEQQDARRAGQGPGHRDQLLLAHRQPRPAFAQRRVVALRQAADEAVGMGGAGGGLDAGRTELATHVNVVAGVGGQQKGFLRHQAHRLSEGVVAQVLHRLAVDVQRARGRRVKAQQQRQERAFAAAGVAHDAHELTGRDVQVQPVQYRVAGLVGKVQIAHRDSPRADAGTRRALRGQRLVQQGVDAGGGHHRLLQLRELHGDLDQRLDHSGDVADERIEHAHLECAQTWCQRCCAAFTQSKHGDDGGQHRHVQEIKRRAQQPGVGAQLGPTGVEMGLVGG